VEKTVGYSGSDIENVCRDASFMPLTRIKVSGNWQEKMEYLKKYEEDLTNQVIGMEDFIGALDSVKPSVPVGILKRYEDWM